MLLAATSVQDQPTLVDPVVGEINHQDTFISRVELPLASSIISVVLVFLLILGLTLGLYRQHRDNQELTIRYAQALQQVSRLETDILWGSEAAGFQSKPKVLPTGGDESPVDPTEAGESISPPGIGISELSNPDQQWLEAFETYVAEHLSDPLLYIPALTKQFAMSESTLLRQSKRLTGLPPVQYLQEMRLTKARELLEKRMYCSIAKVAYIVGYADARSFTRAFRSRFGKLPSEYVKR